MRSVGSPTISFGLISIPTKVYLAASGERFSFNMITPTKDDGKGNITGGNRVKQKLIDAVTGEDVEKGDCLSGYEYAKDQYVTFTDQDIDSLAGERSNAIELQEFVDNSAFNPVQVEKCYYLAPDKGAEKSYRLLSLTMEKSGKVAVGKWYARGKDYLVILAPTNGYLTMFQMYYANEVRAFEYQFSDKSLPSEPEIALAKKLIGQLSTKQFDVKKYNDEFAERIRAAIDVKINGGEQLAAIASAPQRNIIDLMELLKASVAAVETEGVARVVNEKIDLPVGDDLGGGIILPPPEPPPPSKPGLKKTRGKKKE